MKKINGPEIERILLGGHIAMFNMKAVDKYRKPSLFWDNIAVVIAMLSAIYLAAR